jgi:hypothetical protein
MPVVGHRDFHACLRHCLGVSDAPWFEYSSSDICLHCHCRGGMRIQAAAAGPEYGLSHRVETAGGSCTIFDPSWEREGLSGQRWRHSSFRFSTLGHRRPGQVVAAAAGGLAEQVPLCTRHDRRSLRRAGHASLQSGAWRQKSGSSQGISGEHWRFQCQDRHDFLRKGTSGLRRIERNVLGTEQARSHVDLFRSRRHVRNGVLSRHVTRFPATQWARNRY